MHVFRKNMNIYKEMYTLMYMKCNPKSEGGKKPKNQKTCKSGGEVLTNISVKKGKTYLRK